MTGAQQSHGCVATARVDLGRLPPGAQIFYRVALPIGTAQVDWLERSPLDSKTTWKLIASDMPIGIVVPDLNPDVPKGTFESWANADNGPPSGRELEIAGCLSFIKNNGNIAVIGYIPKCPLASPRES